MPDPFSSDDYRNQDEEILESHDYPEGPDSDFDQSGEADPSEAYYESRNEARKSTSSSPSSSTISIERPRPPAHAALAIVDAADKQTAFERAYELFTSLPELEPEKMAVRPTSAYLAADIDTNDVPNLSVLNVWKQSLPDITFLPSEEAQDLVDRAATLTEQRYDPVEAQTDPSMFQSPLVYRTDGEPLTDAEEIRSLLDHLTNVGSEIAVVTGVLIDPERDGRDEPEMPAEFKKPVEEMTDHEEKKFFEWLSVHRSPEIPSSIDVHDEAPPQYSADHEIEFRERAVEESDAINEILEDVELDTETFGAALLSVKDSKERKGGPITEQIRISDLTASLSWSYDLSESESQTIVERTIAQTAWLVQTETGALRINEAEIKKQAERETRPQTDSANESKEADTVSSEDDDSDAGKQQAQSQYEVEYWCEDCKETWTTVSDEPDVSNCEVCNSTSIVLI